MSTMSIGERLQYFRKIHGLTQIQMVEELNKVAGYTISESSYKRLEKPDSEPTLKFLQAFITALKNKPIKDTFNNKPISIFSFLYKDSDDIKDCDENELNVINDAIYNISNLPKYFDQRLFEDIFDVKQPFYKYLIGCPEFLTFLNDIEPLFVDYKKALSEKQNIDNQIKLNSSQAQNKNDYIKKQLAKPAYQNQYVKPLKTLQRNIINNTNDFIIKLLDYYCKN